MARRQATPIRAQIAPRASESAGHGPSWSAMLTVYDRLHTLERALCSVLAQVRPGMQIAVVADRHDAATLPSSALSSSPFPCPRTG